MKYVIDIIENNQITNSNYSPLFLFTTENISELLKNIDVSGKRVLTVSSSADHIFNMLLSGASTIDTFDVNYLTKYYFYFKEAAIRSLSYKEFLNFFFNNFSFNSKVFDNKVFFNKILPNIKDEEAAKFWEYLFNRYGGRRLYNSNLFYNSNSKNTYIACNDYLKDEANYKSLQHKLKNYKYTFYLINIFKKITKLPKVKYDVIYLSNILDKLVCRDKLRYIETLKMTIHRLKKYLVPNGILGVCYLYLFHDEYWNILTPNEITSPDFRNKFFKGTEYTYKTFFGVNDLKGRRYKNRDAIMLMRKKD